MSTTSRRRMRYLNRLAKLNADRVKKLEYRIKVLEAKLFSEKMRSRFMEDYMNRTEEILNEINQQTLADIEKLSASIGEDGWQTASRTYSGNGGNEYSKVEIVDGLVKVEVGTL